MPCERGEVAEGLSTPDLWALGGVHIFTSAVMWFQSGCPVENGPAKVAGGRLDRRLLVWSGQRVEGLGPERLAVEMDRSRWIQVTLKLRDSRRADALGIRSEGKGGI